MKRDYKLYIKDITDSIDLIEIYLHGVSQEEFVNDKEKQDSVIRRLEIIGEASKNIPRVLKEKNKEIPRYDFSQFRDLVTHSYFSTSLIKIWDFAKRLPSIKKQFQNIKLV